MNFSLLSTDDLVEFLNLWEVPLPSNNKEDLIPLAGELFQNLLSRQDAQYTIPVQDLYLAEVAFTNGVSFPEIYKKSDLEKLDPQNKQAFAGLFGLDPADPKFTERLIRILRFFKVVDDSESQPPISFNLGEPVIYQSDLNKGRAILVAMKFPAAFLLIGDELYKINRETLQKVEDENFTEKEKQVQQFYHYFKNLLPNSTVNFKTKTLAGEAKVIDLDPENGFLSISFEDKFYKIPFSMLVLPQSKE